MAGGTETANEDLQSLYNAVLQGFANEDPNNDSSSQRSSTATMASPASARGKRPLPAVPRVAQSVYDSIPPPPPMPTNKRFGMPEPQPAPAPGYHGAAPSTTMTGNGSNGFRRGPSFRPPGAGMYFYYYHYLRMC